MAPKSAAVCGLLCLIAHGCGSSSASGQRQAGGGMGGGQVAPDAAATDTADAGATGGASGATGGGAAIGGNAGNAGAAPVGPGSGGGAGRDSGLGGSGGGMAGGGAGVAGNSPTAGGGAGGQGGDHPGQTLLLPPNCEARANMATDGSCMLSAFCGALPYVTTCQRLDSGRWQCRSEPHYADRIYEIEGVGALQACGVATGLAAKDQLSLGPDSCLPVSEGVVGDSCTASVVCGPTIEVDFAPSAHARLARYGSVECGPVSLPKAISCTFELDDTAPRVDLTTYSDAPACRSLLEFCLSTTAPGFAGPRSCMVAQATAAAEGCQRSELCSLPFPTTEAPGFPTIESRYASCEPESGGGASCYCSARDSLFMFRVASAPDGAACAAAITSCEPTAHIEATGAATCKPTSQTTTSNGCDADLSCTQTATVDGHAVVADGRLLVRCARAQQGRPWSCGCASDQLTTTFSLGAAEATPAQACAQAPQACLTHIPVHLGPYGSSVSAPDPPL